MYVYGRNVLKEILNTDYQVKQVYFTNSKKVDKEVEKLIKKVKEKNISFSFVDNNLLKKLSNSENHQGVITDIGKEFDYKYMDVLDDIKDPYILILDQVQDPHNFGAMVRSAAAAGVDAIIIPSDNSSGVTPTVIKVSAGQIFRIPIIQVTNISRTIKKLKEKNIWVYGADMNGTQYHKVDMTGGFALVMGNEGSGIRQKVKENCDGIISIQMSNDVESLNVSVSAGIIMFEARKQRIKE
ncbi:23S rRNA (guanosine(2251)-2'-O)-methyltransferase RlmB [Oceanotoga sp. DSM 15011]|jgi:23S rRNA (guanosine2251-2'-O)-methyltransferase|uniref:23S rRNA (Guanosine2251-2'-O)-methyltransferase n=1 Tax=Oceanotoga teriensis TaxID=515440 RepID=A0AA45C4J9_9BACT|nr:MULTISPECIES: 23S rRNA (guanosine(2251)-2'-O)-methyltransferase RlmB [Oceanotoga]MDN5341893.1 rRNA (guanosine2251-2-O)-methyltransferase [Oceanotoga sp.]MDO7977844.1 23S rRNA (guanosine(2251)-2'-O)-methyltransferase RlmB [Oceanotoga teriensis]PWJ86114.1 23S rRNA (guanosine2251-2'-O)-methyltransferase [Oceanotoga teriensis]UYP00727.1 23S rRNA (guanosine(2251)-2'-O)-methyltransferase RlmB [Oceanotoga sp. DSM 15011]